ncbi:MAG: DNA-3-methyladenine glycosylase family protein [Candidatus Dormibacterales bacterium]
MALAPGPPEPLTSSFAPRPLPDLALTLGVLRRGGAADPTMAFEPAGVWRASRTPAGPATVHLRARSGRIEVEAWGPGAGWALEAAPALVGALDDRSGFRPAHPLVAELARRHVGLRMTRPGGVFESLLPTILEQKVVGLEARRAYVRMVRALGEPAPGPRSLMLPPAPERLAATPYWVHHPFGVERRRAVTLARAAARAPWLEASAAAPAEVYRRLLSLPGVGAWSAAMVGLTALGDADAVPTGDYHLPHVVAWALGGRSRGDDAQMLDLLEPYRGHRGRVLRLLLAAGVAPPRRAPRLRLRAIAGI